jgi:type II secretory pathway predicted ATPase ExeA
MYEGYFGLQERPFDLTANPRFLFLSSGHREALSNLQYGMEVTNGITLLIGEAGTGKTTLIRAALEQQRGANFQGLYLSNPTLTRSEFYEFLTAGFGLSRAAATSKTIFLRELEPYLLGRLQAGQRNALIVDEAQSLPHELLEEIRLLANLETQTTKLLSVILTGQPELADRLNDTSLRQLKQRVALRCSLPPFDLRETAAYIAKRIRIAGGDSASVFTREAVEAIYQGSHGIARTISVIGDNALINGFALQRRPVDADVVIDVCRDFDLNGPVSYEGRDVTQPALRMAAAANGRETTATATDFLRATPTIPVAAAAGRGLAAGAGAGAAAGAGPRRETPVGAGVGNVPGGDPRAAGPKKRRFYFF